MSDLSKHLTKILTKEEHKMDGIYFTPPKDVKYIVTQIIKYNKDIKYILEPSCGSCEFIEYLDNTMNNVIIDGYESNKTIYTHIKKLKFKNKVTLYNQDFFNNRKKQKYDLIIGNPPYYEVTHKNNLFDSKKNNIYLLFILKCLSLLKEDGILAFVLPNSFLNNRYANKFREYLMKYEIHKIHLFENSKYLNTSQDTCLFILQNKPSISNKFSIKINDDIYFNSSKNIKLLNRLIRNSTTLKKLNIKVNVGTILWNENKALLTNDKKYTRLIYNTDIKNTTILDNSDTTKKRYIKLTGNMDKVLVVNRGHGTSKYKFNYALVKPTKPILFENHVLVLKGKNLNKIKKSFDNEKTLLFIKTFFSNNAINVYEMKNILPIYV